MYYVYALIDPINKIPFYIGKGKGGRAWVHFQKAHKDNKDKLNIIKYIKLLGWEPQVYIIQENIKTSKEALLIEGEYILEYKEFLTNKDNILPDRTGSIMSAEQKHHLSIINTGKNLTEEHKTKIGIANLRKVNYMPNKKYLDKSKLRNEGSKNPRARKIKVNGITFGCVKDAYNFYEVSGPTFRKRYKYEYLVS